MLVSDYIDKLPDEQYKKCAITPTSVTMPIDAPILATEMREGLMDTTLTDEKAVCLAAQHIVQSKSVVDPLAKLTTYYRVKSA